MAEHTYRGWLARGGAVALLSLLTPGVQAAADTCPVAADSADSSGRDSVFMNSLRGEALSGSKDGLVAAVTRGEKMAVSWYNWEGQVYAECTNVDIGPDMTVRCQVEAWCDEAIDGIPGAHAQRVTLTSAGATSTLVMTVREKTGEKSLLAVSSNPSPVEWFVVDRGSDRSVVDAN